jgi:hypothetical protein
MQDRYNAHEAGPRWQKAWDARMIVASANSDPRLTDNYSDIIIIRWMTCRAPSGRLCSSAPAAAT